MVAVIAVLVATALMSTLSFSYVSAASNDTATRSNAAAKSKIEVSKEPSVNAGSAVVFSASTSQLVYSLHKDRKLSPGSLTKLMTAMIVIDNMHSSKEFSAKVDVTKEAAEKDKNLGAAGDTLKVEELLALMLVKDSEEAAKLLVKYSTSRSSVFVNEMNSKAISIGLLNTQFTNATGSYSVNQYSSAYDCAVMTQYALRYEAIRNILCDTKNDIEYPDLCGSLNSVIQAPKSAQYMGFADKKDMQLVVVMLDADERTRQSEAKHLLTYGYQKVKMNTIIKADKKVGKAKIRHGVWTHVSAYTEGKGYAYIPPEGSEALVQTQVVMLDNLSAPLPAGSKVGEYRIYIADELKGTVDLVTKKDIDKGWFPSYLYISNFMTVVLMAVVLLILLLIFRIKQLKRRKEKMKKLKRQQKIREAARKQMEIEEDRRRRGWTYHE